MKRLVPLFLIPMMCFSSFLPGSCREMRNKKRPVVSHKISAHAKSAARLPSKLKTTYYGDGIVCLENTAQKTISFNTPEGSLYYDFKTSQMTWNDGHGKTKTISLKQPALSTEAHANNHT